MAKEVFLRFNCHYLVKYVFLILEATTNPEQITTPSETTTRGKPYFKSFKQLRQSSRRLT